MMEVFLKISNLYADTFSSKRCNAECFFTTTVFEMVILKK